MPNEWGTVEKEVYYRLDKLEERQEKMISQLQAVSSSTGELSMRVLSMDTHLSELRSAVQSENREQGKWRQQSQATLLTLKFMLILAAALTFTILGKEAYLGVMKLLIG